MIPSWLQYLQTGLQTCALTAIPFIGAWLAWQQVKIARVKLQHDLFERRYRVFDATRKLLISVLVTGTASEEAHRAFALDTVDAVFLFDDDLARYLEETGKHAVTLRSTNRKLELMPMGEQKTKSIDGMMEHQLWFNDQLTSLVDTFKPFLKLDKR